MEKLSDILKKIMLGILLGIMILTLILVVREGLVSKSYLIALAAGAVWSGALLFWLQRREKQGKPALTIRLSPCRAILCISAFSLIINLAWVLLVRIEPFSDYETYWQCAVALATGGEIEAPWYIAMYPHILGTATFLSFFVGLFGESVLMVSIVNVVLTVLSGVLIFYICIEISGLETASAAALFWAVCPCKLMLNSLVFSEPLYTCLILLFMLLMLCLHRWINEGRVALAVCSPCGALLGLILQFINIVRPIALILVIAILIWLVMLRGAELKNKKSWCTWLNVIAPLLAVYALSGSLWTGHVARVVGMEPAAVPVYNIYVGFNEATRGQWSADDMDLLFSYLSQPGVTPGAAQESLLPLLRERLASGIDFAGLFSDKLVAFMGNDELGGYTYRFTRGELFVKLCMVICNVFYYGVFLLAIYGLVRMLAQKYRSTALLLPLYVIGLTLAHMLVEVANRYHYSIIPMLIIFAALAFSRRENV